MDKRTTYSSYMCRIEKCEFETWTRKDLARHMELIHYKKTHDLNDLKVNRDKM